MAVWTKGDICIAFSGGVDSSLLLYLAVRAAAKHGSKVYAVTFQTKLHPPGRPGGGKGSRRGCKGRTCDFRSG